MPESLKQILARHAQEHLLRFWDELTGDERDVLSRQVQGVDFAQIDRLVRDHRQANAADTADSPADRARRATPPAETIRLPASDADRAKWRDAERRGRELLAAGKVGAILVAGGQGTRLGFDKPKGMFPIGPVSNATLFQVLAEQLLARSRDAGRPIPYYIMTSDATHDETVEFFREQQYFGLRDGDVFFFPQGNMPAVDAQTGRLLLAERGRLALSPDGHGGLLAALASAGLLDDMRQRGVEVLHYHQVDNPTARVCDPAFLGFHDLCGSEMSTKVVAKRSPEERMGIVVDVDGTTQIVEYIHVPDDVARQTDAGGNLLLWAGSTAIHVFDRAFLELVAADSTLPFQVARKKVPHVDASGRLVTPETENAFKFERFIFDAMPLAARALVLEADRAAEFNPVKNADGHDSPATAQQAISALHASWLREAGGHVADDAVVEISPLFALGPEALRGKIDAGEEYSGAVYLRG